MLHILGEKTEYGECRVMGCSILDRVVRKAFLKRTPLNRDLKEVRQHSK